MSPTNRQTEAAAARQRVTELEALLEKVQQEYCWFACAHHKQPHNDLCDFITRSLKVEE